MTDVRKRRCGVGHSQPNDLALRPPTAGADQQERRRSASEPDRHAHAGPRLQRGSAAIDAQREERCLHLGR